MDLQGGDLTRESFSEGQLYLIFLSSVVVNATQDPTMCADAQPVALSSRINSISFLDQSALDPLTQLVSPEEDSDRVSGQMKAGAYP